MYKYKVVNKANTINSRQWSDVEKELNELGQDGWRIVPVDSHVIIMEREACCQEPYSPYTKSFRDRVTESVLVDIIAYDVLQEIKRLEGENNV